MVQNYPKLAQTSAHGTNGECEFCFRFLNLTWPAQEPQAIFLLIPKVF